ncbi:MAG: pantetheine-phosphate adenylyltransferase [Candidatus Hydrogenedentota bacterium]
MRTKRGTAVYPGSFDPATNGHIDIAHRAAEIFDRVIVAVLDNSTKATLFTPDERAGLLRASLPGAPTIEIVKFSGLLVDLMHTMGAGTIIRGLRFVSDFEYELQMALMNQALEPGIETVFLVAAPERTFVSSTLVKEVARLGRDISQFVPPVVAEAMRAKFA